VKTQERKSAKTIGLSLSTWKKLKMYAIENDCASLSDAVEGLINAKQSSEVQHTKKGAEKKNL
jgi:macrodomain Ter protein organizer (MatP/YcbG family)